VRLRRVLLVAFLFAPPRLAGADAWIAARADLSSKTSPALAAFPQVGGLLQLCKIHGRLDRGDESAHVLAATIRAKAPLSLKIALAQMQRGRAWSFDECMRAEFRIVSRIVEGEDFYEGVRAVIVDKDNAPRWRPATFAEATVGAVERHFAPLARELDLP